VNNAVHYQQGKQLAPWDVAYRMVDGTLQRSWFCECRANRPGMPPLAAGRGPPALNAKARMR
jgi:hypothetical protein